MPNHYEIILTNDYHQELIQDDVHTTECSLARTEFLSVAGNAFSVARVTPNLSKLTRSPQRFTDLTKTFSSDVEQ